MDKSDPPKGLSLEVEVSGNWKKSNALTSI